MIRIDAGAKQVTGWCVGSPVGEWPAAWTGTSSVKVLPATRRALKADVTAHGLCQAAADRQTEAGATGQAGARAAVEGAKDPLSFLFVDATSRVRNRDAEPRLAGGGG